MHKKRILIAFGTRPEALKFVPLIYALRNHPRLECYVCLTGQHRQMLDQVIDFFRIRIDEDLRLMRTNQSLEYVSGRVISRFGHVVKKMKPDIVFVQGDTATALMVGIATFYAKRPIAHLEAGLRTWDKFQPFPEEMNRSLLSHLADLHFTPTRIATRNLLGEGIPREAVFEVGNTVVDTIKLAAPRIRAHYSIFRQVNFRRRILFMTAHRRESFGAGLQNIFHAIRQIVERFPDVEIVYPVHLNPNVHLPAHKILGGIKRIHLMRPLTYEETHWLMAHCYAILTDSGGIQEEAPSFKKPVLILRNVTERTEGIRAGIARLVGTDAKRIFKESATLLTQTQRYRQMRARINPYGDGRSTQRIVKILSKELDRKPFHWVAPPDTALVQQSRVKVSR